MDYDDDDISRHNLQLAGEGRSRSSSVLRPYVFPKFDFDDSLQGHLRFVNLVETEVFLGIQNQEDNHWIEDFSRVSNGMEFNPTPADSCSISRGNNVWSEATSSESVEMLLKSVGQEEMMPGESNIPESNSGDGQDTLTNHLKPGNIQAEQNDGKTNNSETSLPQDISFKDYNPKESRNEQLTETVTPSESDGKYACVSSCNLPHNAVCGEDGTSTNERDSTFQDVCAVENLQELKPLTASPTNCAAGEESFHSSRIADNNSNQVTLVSKISEQVDAGVSHEICSDNGLQKPVCAANKKEDTEVLEENPVVSSILVNTIGSPSCLVTESGVVGSQEAVNENLDSAKETADLCIEEKSEIKLSGGDGNVSVTASIQTEKEEVLVSPTNSEIDSPFKDCPDGSAVDNTKQHSGGSRVFDAASCASPEQTDASVELISRQDNVHIEYIPGSPNKDKSISQTPSFSVEDKASLNSCDCDVGMSSDVAVLSTDGGNRPVYSVEGCHNDAKITRGEPVSEPPASVVRDSKQVLGESSVDVEANIPQTGQDIPKTEEEDKELSNDAGIVVSENVENTRLLDVIEEIKGNPAEDGQIKPTVTRYSLSDSDDKEDDKEVATQVASDAECKAEKDCFPKVRVSVLGDATRTLHCDMSAKSPQFAEKKNEFSSSQSPETEYIDPLEMSQLEGSSLKDSVIADDANEKQYEMATKKEERDMEPAYTDADKTSCGSPTVISSSEPTLIEKDYLEQARGSEAPGKSLKNIQSASEVLENKDTFGEDTSFTFKITALPDGAVKECGQSWSLFPTAGKRDSSVVVEETTPSGKGNTPRASSKETPSRAARVPEGESTHKSSRGTSERKGRKASAKGMTKENVKKDNHTKGTNQECTSNKGDKVSSKNNSPHPQLGQMQPPGHVESTSTKLLSTVAVPATNISDLSNSALNNSSSLTTPYRQPFTDLQQVQLRAQIFVYGSLIQGTAPDEACMVSAFGPSDGGRSAWEPVWRTAVERVRSQKSNCSAAETPLHLRSGVRVSDAPVKQGSHSSKVLSSPGSRASSGKGNTGGIVNPIIPLSSPLWNVSTPSHDSTASHKSPIADYQNAITPVHSFQTTPGRNFVGNASWPSQPCFPSSWIASPQNSTFNSSIHFQPVSMTETVKLTPVKETSGSGLLTSGMKHMTPSLAVQTVGPSPVLLGVSPVSDSKKVASAEKHSVELKPRKRKKIPASDPGPVSLLSESGAQPVIVSSPATKLSSPASAHTPPSAPFPAPAVPVPFSSSVAPVPFPAPASPTSSAVPTNPAPAPAPAPYLAYTSVHAPVLVPASPASDAVLRTCVVEGSAFHSGVRSKEGDMETGKAVSCSEETLGKVTEAKREAEDAAALAASAVSHSEDLWSRLAKEQKSGITSEVEAKLVSSVVAIAAAASVAKAAAAAAKVAFNAALLAKQMADEAFSSKTNGLASSSVKSAGEVYDMGSTTPTSILKGNNTTNQSNTILTAAKEAAKKRLEAASAASKQAENLDAIVKAAELAAAAVSQAGTIVAMGEPLPLSNLIEAGPEGYWKLPQSSSELANKQGDGNKEQPVALSLREGAETSAKVSKEDSEMYQTGKSSETFEGHLSMGVVSMGTVHTSEGDFSSLKGSTVSDTGKSDAAPRAGGVQIKHDEVGATQEDIREGSVVEVFKHGDGLKSAWYPANILKLEDGKAFVCLNHILSEEGSGNLCEWVSLESGDKAPIIRPTHPLTALAFQRTRKRARAALIDYAWSIGDKVDVWIDDCWCEGVVTEKNEKDETTLKVHFPAQRETSTVKAWDIRTARSWDNGKWVEWSSSKGNNPSEQSDLPQEKRQKLGSPAVPNKGKDKSAIEQDSALVKSEEAKLALSTSERVFDIGKTTKEDNKRPVRKTLRGGQQKEGTGVIFGVPKPTGKKRKFMEVSKHFPANRSDKGTGSNDTVKFSRYLMPQGTAARGWKVPGRNDSKEKPIANSRSRVSNSRRPQRTLPQRNDRDSTVVQDSENMTDKGNDLVSASHGDNVSKKLEGLGLSASEDAAEAPLSSFLSHSLSASKKFSSLSSRSDRLNRGKVASSSGKLSKIEEDKAHAGHTDKLASEASEPRRSNRRTQPTHRLLEGLQSSLMIPKLPSVLHDKGQKNRGRNVSNRGK